MQPRSRAISAAHCQRDARRSERPKRSGTKALSRLTPKMTAQAVAQLSRSKVAGRVAARRRGWRRGRRADSRGRPALTARIPLAGGAGVGRGDDVGQRVGAGLGGGVRVSPVLVRSVNAARASRANCRPSSPSSQPSRRNMPLAVSDSDNPRLSRWSWMSLSGASGWS